MDQKGQRFSLCILILALFSMNICIRHDALNQFNINTIISIMMDIILLKQFKISTKITGSISKVAKTFLCRFLKLKFYYNFDHYL